MPDSVTGAVGITFWAAFLPPREPEPVPLLDDSELPVYSVLLPLRDEAQMVQQLSNALRGLDYPALCIKRTKGATA